MDSPGNYIRCACSSSSVRLSPLRRRDSITFYDCRCLDCNAMWRIRSRQPHLQIIKKGVPSGRLHPDLAVELLSRS